MRFPLTAKVWAAIFAVNWYLYPIAGEPNYIKNTGGMILLLAVLGILPIATLITVPIDAAECAVQKRRGTFNISSDDIRFQIALLFLSVPTVLGYYHFVFRNAYHP